MAPAVPFALLGVVQLLAVASWIGLAGAALFPRLRRRVTPAFVLGALVMAAADVVTAVRIDTASSSSLGWVRAGGLLLLGLGALGGAGQSQVVALPAGGAAAVVAPLGASVLPSVAGAVAGGLAAVAAWVRGLRPGADRVLGGALAAAFALTGVAAALGTDAGHSSNAALAVLSARSAATLAIGIALVQLARTMLLGKLLGAILVGVVAMAAGAVGIVGTGVADAVQVQQSQRLLQVAQGEQQTLRTLTDRAALYAQVVAQCPKQQQQCIEFLTLFSEQPDYFAVVVQPTGARVVAPTHSALSAASLLQLSGDPIVQAALKQGASPRSFSGGPVLLRGAKPTLALVAAVPGRPGGSSDARIKPTYAAVYGVGLVDAYLASIRRTTGYDVTVLADGHALASSLDQRGRAQVVDAARRAHVEQLDPAA